MGLCFGNKSVNKKSYNLSTFVDLDETSAGNTLKKLQEFENKVNSGSATWQEYFSNLKDGQKWQVEFVQNNDLQKASIDNVIAANKAARISAIQHNAALKAQTLGAKAAAVGMKALAIASNVIAIVAIAKGIELAYKAFDNFIHSTEKAKEAAEDARQTFSTLQNEVGNINKELEENAKRIDELFAKGTLTYVEEAELKKLKEATRELKLQQDYKERELKQAAEEKYEADKKSFGKEFGSGDFSSETVQHIASISDTQNNDQYEKQGNLTLLK